MFENGENLVWNASPALGEEDISGAFVTYKERTGANTATVQRGDVLSLKSSWMN